MADEKPEQEQQLSESFQKELEDLRKQRDEYLAGWQRARADLINYKKEEMARIGEMASYVTESIVQKLLPLVDNIEIVEQNLPENVKNNVHVKGLLQLKTQLQDFLKSNGVQELEAEGQKFNPEFHEAVEEVDVKEKEAAIVAEVVQKGYLFHGHVLRPAKVKVVK
ncbi:MAG: nucleotide exchange factor GrpE [Candidatus Wildermuthbacteria bacterium]|nr:nucleotide exchange factor GrpE [Candidatus Wildermuthbacteria bacterium]